MTRIHPNVLSQILRTHPELEASSITGDFKTGLDSGRDREPAPLAKEEPMLWTIAVILIILWAVGLLSGYTMGLFIHVLLVVAVVLILVRLIQGRRIV